MSRKSNGSEQKQGEIKSFGFKVYKEQKSSRSCTEDIVHTLEVLYKNSLKVLNDDGKKTRVGLRSTEAIKDLVAKMTLGKNEERFGRNRSALPRSIAAGRYPKNLKREIKVHVIHWHT